MRLGVNFNPAWRAYLQDDVEAFLQQKLGSVAAETAIGAFNELYSYVLLVSAWAVQCCRIHAPIHSLICMTTFIHQFRNAPPHNSKYKLMENSCERTKLNLKAKIPDIEKTLELVRVLQEKQVGAMGRGTVDWHC